MTLKQVTSPPWNSKEMVWASRWSVALRAFYSFFLWNFRPRLVRALLVRMHKYSQYSIHFYLKIIGVNGLSQAPNKNVFFPSPSDGISSRWQLVLVPMALALAKMALKLQVHGNPMARCSCPVPEVFRSKPWVFWWCWEEREKNGKVYDLSETNITRRPSQKETHLPTPVF